MFYFISHLNNLYILLKISTIGNKRFSYCVDFTFQRKEFINCNQCCFVIDINDSLPFNIMGYMVNKCQQNSETNVTKYQEESCSNGVIMFNLMRKLENSNKLLKECSPIPRKLLSLFSIFRISLCSIGA